jgi:Peptidase inhibitor family I36
MRHALTALTSATATAALAAAMLAPTAAQAAGAHRPHDGPGAPRPGAARPGPHSKTGTTGPSGRTAHGHGARPGPHGGHRGPAHGHTTAGRRWHPAGRRPTAAPAGRCDAGEFCVWTGTRHTGHRYVWDLSTAGIENCVALPAGVSGRSFANRVGRPVTVYQDRTCGSEAEFDTYPGDGTWVPESSFTVRALKVWEN